MGMAGSRVGYCLGLVQFTVMARNLSEIKSNSTTEGESNGTTSTTRQQESIQQQKSIRNAIQLLTADHEKISKIFEQYKKPNGKVSDEEKRALVKQACNALTVHAQIEG